MFRVLNKAHLYTAPYFFSKAAGVVECEYEGATVMWLRSAVSAEDRSKMNTHALTERRTIFNKRNQVLVQYKTANWLPAK